MQLLVFIVVYPFLWLVSLLPFKLLYLVSDFLYFIIYRLVGYRKKVVRENLKLVFPEKPQEELRRIEKTFYSHMCDMFLEMIKTMNISDEQLQKRFTYTNVEVLHELEAQNKSIMLMFPHYASWEWVISLDKHIQSKGYGIYKPVDNKYFDRLVRNIRGKFGTTLLATRNTVETVEQNKLKGQLSMYGILSDQNPIRNKAHHWCTFMGIMVPVHTGAELLCKRLKLPAVYLKVEKLKRGHYQGTFKVLSEAPSTFKNYDLTELFLSEVEKQVYETPEYYFWTHKRWKHRNRVPEEYLTDAKA